MGYVWFYEKNLTLITQTTIEQGTPESAHSLVRDIDEIMKRVGDRVRAGESLTILHDWRSLKRQDPAARAIINRSVRQRPKGYCGRAFLVVEPNPIWKLAFAVTDMIFATLGMPPPKVTGDVQRAFEEVRALCQDQPAAWLK